MPFIQALFKQTTFSPEMTNAMGIAYDKLAAELGLDRTDDPLTRRLAATVIEVAATGQRDPDKLCAGVTALLMQGKRQARRA